MKLPGEPLRTPLPRNASPLLTRDEPATRPAGNITEGIYQASLEWMDKSAGRHAELTPLGELLAPHLAAGGMVYLAGNPGFIDELETRAGLFPFSKPWTGQALTEHDVLLVGEFRSTDQAAQERTVRQLARDRRTFAKGTVVHIGGHSWPGLRGLGELDRAWWGRRLVLIDNQARAGGGWRELCVGQLSTTVLAIMLHGEIISAASRRGITLASYGSDWEPGCVDWDAFVRLRHVHPRYDVPPIPAGELARRYHAICRRYIADFLAGEPGQVRLAAQRLARHVRDGGEVWTICDGHVHGRGAYIPPDMPAVTMIGRSYRWSPTRMPEGVMLLWMGYLRMPYPALDTLLKRGHSAVLFCVDPGPSNSRLVTIRSHWTDYDSVIDLPGYPIRVLPASGVVQTPQWYSIMAETHAAWRALP